VQLEADTKNQMKKSILVESADTLVDGEVKLQGLLK
jgi:hypothetical protein